MAEEHTAFEVGRLFVPLSAIANTLVASQKDIFIRLPGLLAYWTGGTRGAAAALSDHSGSVLPLSQNNTVPTAYDGNSYVHLGNGINYLKSVSSVFGVTGAETFIDASIRGITFGGWFMVDSLPASAAGLVSKDGVAPQRGYSVQVTSGGVFTALFSGNGAAVITANSASYPISAWRFIVARFIPSTEVAVFVDGDKSTNTTAVPVAQFVSTQQFEVGRSGALDARIAHAKARDVFICAAALSDALIEEIRVTSVP